MTKILLIGGGHAHLSILKNLLNEKPKHYEVTLITSSKYTKMDSRTTEDLFSEEEIKIDLEDLCEKASVTFVEDTVISFDPLQKMLLSFSGAIHHFDVISFDIDMKFSLFKQALVPVDADGRMQVENTLQNTQFPFLFGAGKCVAIAQQPEITVNSDKQGILLWSNIKKFLAGQKLKPLNSGSKLTLFDRLLGRLLKK